MNQWIHKRKNEDQDQNTNNVYRLFKKKTGSLGGAAAGGSIYGEVTERSFDRLVQMLVNQCDLDNNSIFLDIGSGLGKPNLHTSVYPGVKYSFGVEISGARWWQSLVVLKSFLENGVGSNVFMAHADILSIDTFDPITHIYSFNTGFPFTTMQHIAKCFNESSSAKWISCYDNPSTMSEYGFDVSFIQKIPMKLNGSGNQHMCYTYKNNTSTLNSCTNKLWTLPPIPTDKKYTPHVEHTETYTKGLDAMYNLDMYKEWIESQIGLDRARRKTRYQNK